MAENPVDTIPVFWELKLATYLELKAKAEQLLAEAEELREKELRAVIAEIKEKMATYGIKPQDLGFAGNTRGRAKATAAAKSIKYRGPNGETWNGGRGRKPQWVVDALKAGKKIEDFAV